MSEFTPLHLLESLNQKLFDAGVEQVPIRKGFGDGLLAAAKADERVVGLCADLTESTYMLPFKKEFPERFIEMGVAEQNLATVASGLAAAGKIPFITSYAMFSPGRNWEQIRTTIAYNDQPVKIVGSHAGISVGPDGGTHQAVEDLALMRVIPNMTVLAPCDALEARKATLAAAKNGTPVYIRLVREKTPIITTEATDFKIGRMQIFFEPGGGKTAHPQATIFVTGGLMHRALVAAKKLFEQGRPVRVVNVASIKPLDEAMLDQCARETGAFVTVEEHQISGGLGGAIAEWAGSHHPLPIERVGVKDEFGQSGTPDQLIAHYHMDTADIVQAALRAIMRGTHGSRI